MTSPPEFEEIPKYTEFHIASALARKMFNGHLCVVDDCSWPGSECDLLVVHKNLKLIDVEIKISRADLRNDKDKDKWKSPQYDTDPVTGRWRVNKERTIVQWPKNIWRHYYVIAGPVWKDELMQFCGETSGVIAIWISKSGNIRYSVKRKAKNNPAAKPVDNQALLHISRLASLRMWDAYKKAYPIDLDKRNKVA